ncbi:hypothetical protein SAMN05192545_3917 [Maribacter dokdonensis]|uniref:Uncharacterized protein n=1 Tax=Maribacter dokdonensis TaxID=320912 RepID=A0ABY0V0I1_9FLAO|nr:hypothetical protein [Maribacter dokdonensis]SDT46993.1 hypothetical protein SAMN05192545_3917 [Maribacter dokdonensis]
MNEFLKTIADLSFVTSIRRDNRFDDPVYEIHITLSYIDSPEQHSQLYELLNEQTFFIWVVITTA